MNIDQIQQKVRKLNAASPKAKKVAAARPATPHVNGGTVINLDDHLQVAAMRIVAAFHLEKQGVTAETLVAGVKQHEAAPAALAPYTGPVQ